MYLWMKIIQIVWKIAFKFKFVIWLVFCLICSCSRAHTIVGVTFTQKRKNEAGEETAKTSLINLVDLAGR